MKGFIIALIVFGVIFVLLLASYIFTALLLNKFFCRMDFVKPGLFISYDDIKDKYEREEHSFKSGPNKLKAYLYKGKKENDLIVYVHGMCEGHQGYMSDIISLVNRGYNVFTYDFTATGDSEGKHYSGLDQQRYDLAACLKYLKHNDCFGYKNIYLYGHSMGAYAVAVTNNHLVKAKVAISGFEDQIGELIFAFSKGKKNIGSFIVSLMVRFKYFIDRGLDYNLKSSKMLKKANCRTLIIHGANDEIVPLKESINSKQNKINNSLVEYMVIEDENHSSHNSIIASTECVLYQKEKQKIFDEAIKEGKSKAEAKALLAKDIDVFKFNQANEELMEVIDNFYQAQ